MTLTMVTLATDTNPFIPVMKPHNAKQTQTSAKAGTHVKLEIKMELRIVFQLPQKSTMAFNPASSTNTS